MEYIPGAAAAAEGRAQRRVGATMGPGGCWVCVCRAQDGWVRGQCYRPGWKGALGEGAGQGAHPLKASVISRRIMDQAGCPQAG